jgi:hypothetical protein
MQRRIVMTRADCRKAKIGVEDLEVRNLTTALSAHAALAGVRHVAVSPPAVSHGGLATVVQRAEPMPEPWSLLNPNPEDSREPRGPIGPVSKIVNTARV